jgi:uncharacterized protein YhjY with autotransporter beta-barrel domain
MRAYGFLARARQCFALFLVFASFFTSLGFAQVGGGTLPTLVSPTDGQTILASGTTTYRITVSNLSGTPYLYFFYVQLGMAPNLKVDLALGSPVGLVEAQNGVNYSWPASLGTGSFNIYVYAQPTSGPEPANFSNVVKINVVDGGIDTVPDSFSFARRTNQPQNSICSSESIVLRGLKNAPERTGTTRPGAKALITGINAPTPVSVGGVRGSEISIDGGAWTTSGFINNNQRLEVRHTTAAAFSTTTTSIVDVGGVRANFDCTTEVEDTTPDPFAIPSQSNQPLNSFCSAQTSGLAGINSPVVATIDGTGEILASTGAWVTSVLVGLSDRVLTVRQRTSTSPNTSTTAVLNIGGVTAAFTCTTAATVNDTTPDPFSFASQTGVLQSTTITSNVVAITGINADSPISIANGEYSINGGAFTSAAGTLSPIAGSSVGPTVQVRHTSAATPGTNTVTTLTIGGVGGSFTSTTIGLDTTPDPVAFADQLGIEPNSVLTSNTQTITGINTTIEVSVVGGQFSINGGPFGTANARANNGDTIAVRHTSSTNFNTPTITTLTLGNTSATFRSLTRQASTTNLPTARIIAPTAGSRFVAPASFGVNIAIDDPSAGTTLSRVRVNAGVFAQDASLSTQSCPPQTSTQRCVVYRAVFSDLPANTYTITAAIDYNVGGVSGTVGTVPVTVEVTPQPVTQGTSDIVIVGNAPRIVPGANVVFAVRAIDSQARAIPNVPLRWTITNGNTKRADRKAACSGVANDTPNTQLINTGTTGEATITFQASCAAGGRELTVAVDQAGGFSKRIQLVGPNQATGELNLVGYSTTAPLILGASTQLTARVVDGTSPVSGAVTTWSLTPANAGTVQSPVQADENGEAKSTLVLNSGTVEATLNVCVDGRANTCKSYRVRSAVATIIAPATTIANAAVQQAIAAPRVQITQIRDRMQQLRNEQASGFYNGVGVSFPGGRVGTDAATGEKKDDEKSASRTAAPRALSAFALGDVSLTQKSGQVGFDVSTRGLTIGTDYRFSKEWVAGAALGYSRAITEFNAGGEQKATNVSGSVFAQWLPANNTYLNVAANAGRGSYKLERVASDLSIARASPKGQQLAAQIEAGYMWSAGAFRLQPFLRGEHSRGTIDPIVESGSSEALEIEKQRVRANVLSAGVNADYAISSNLGVFIPSARLEFYRESQKVENSFARLVSGSPVVVPLAADPFDRSYGTFGLNLQWLTGVYGTPISSFVGYEHTFGKTGLKVNRFLLGIKIPIQ